MNLAQHSHFNVSNIPPVPPKILIHANDVVHQSPPSILVHQSPPSILRPSQFHLDMPQQQQQSHTIFGTHLLQQNKLSETRSLNVEQKQTEPQQMIHSVTNLPLPQQSQAHTFDMNAAMNSDPLFELPNGEIVTADKLIAHGSNDAFDGNFAASEDPVLRLLSSVALKVTKLEINDKSHERRMANIERGIGLILDAMNIDRSSDVGTSKELANKEPLGSLASKFIRMDTVADLDKFEDKLRNPAFFKEKVKYYIIILTYECAHNEIICPSFYYLQMEQLKLICSDSTMSEINLSYSIIDVMFTRKLFTRVSWAGGSKSGETKAPFRKYVRILRFFIDLVSVCHPNWTETSAIDFFKKKVISCATACKG